MTAAVSPIGHPRSRENRGCDDFMHATKFFGAPPFARTRVNGPRPAFWRTAATQEFLKLAQSLLSQRDAVSAIGGEATE